MKLRWHSAKGNLRPPPATMLIPLSIDVRVEVEDENGSYCTWAFAALSSGTNRKGYCGKNEWFHSSTNRPLSGVIRWAEEL
ncbi:MAG TPA: hypothetical protein VGM92_14195 [Candidatus Kapabacteria bacterium]